MEGLFIIIAIFIGIANMVAKQKQNQAKGNRQYSPKSQSPARRQNNIPESLKKVIMDLESSWGEGQGNSVENKPVQVPAYDEEGTELEDRKKLGSLEYIEQIDSLEGTCDEHPEHGQLIGNEKKAAPASRMAVKKEDLLIDLTEDNLLKGIVMAEIFGPPRAYKRRIR